MSFISFIIEVKCQCRCLIDSPLTKFIFLIVFFKNLLLYKHVFQLVLKGFYEAHLGRWVSEFRFKADFIVFAHFVKCIQVFSHKAECGVFEVRKVFFIDEVVHFLKVFLFHKYVFFLENSPKDQLNKIKNFVGEDGHLLLRNQGKYSKPDRDNKLI